MWRTALLVCLALTACGGSGESAGACADAISYGGETRAGIWVADIDGPWPDLGERVTVYVPRCDDGGGVAGGHETTLFTLEGIAPEVALIDRRHSVLYLGEAYFLNARSHPLHDVFFGSPRQPDESRGKPCRPIAAVSGPITEADGRGGRITVAGAEPWRVDAFTEIHAPRVHGVPLPRAGERAHVSGVLCGKTRRVARLIVSG
jgi:hypothetical protein